VVVIEGNKEFIWDKLDKSRKVINLSYAHNLCCGSGTALILVSWTLIRIHRGAKVTNKKRKKNFTISYFLVIKSSSGFGSALT
jgi:hypothetical protein